ncbi:MAG TPA: HAD family phosphatase [Syntrophorhabdaceae bacterium]|nr:HAD family phosphatase [Syntrophorhabdaceae bacterium]
MEKQTRALFWDNDGVLVDTERLYYVATRRVLETVGISLTQEQYIQSILIDGKGVWHLAAKRGLNKEDVERLRQERNVIYNLLLQREHILMEDVQNVLELLSGKYIMAIVTSSLPGHFKTIHERTGFLRYFQFAVTAQDFTNSKPHPEPYLVALRRAKLRPEECLAIEDSERGLAAATAAGLRCIVIPNKLTKRCSFGGAYKVVENISELLNLLR